MDRFLQPAGVERRCGVGYDRNDKTIEAFKEAGFTIIHAHELVQNWKAAK